MVWLSGGRGMGLLWTVALVSRLNVGDYGLYGMGFALAAVLGPPLDNPFAIRAIRESEERFVRERATRFLMGLLLIGGGLVLIPVTYIGWFGLVAAGGEIAFNCIKSRYVRDGHPDRASRLDTIRQTVSTAIASAYLFATPHPTLLVASLLYCLPYVVIVMVAAGQAIGHRPGIPGPPKLIAAMIAEMGGMALYLQGDVLLLGWLTDSATVGYYRITWMVAASIVAVGQSFAATYHEPLREAEGDLSAGPPLRNTLALGAAAGLLVLVIGIGLLLSPAPAQLGYAMLIMSGFCAMRTINWVFMVVLYTQRKDLFRLATSLGLVPVKLALVAALAVFGAVGAATASVITDAILLTMYSIVLYRKAPS